MREVAASGSESTTTKVSSPADASYRRHVWVATAMWVALLLAVTLERSIPALPSAAGAAMRVLGVLIAAYIVLVRPPGLSRDPDRSPLLLGAFVAVPAVGAILALYRVEPGDALNHLASILALVAAGCLDFRALAQSVHRALLMLIAASLVIGVVYSPTVDPNERAFLRPVYDGRLRGLLGSANVLGECGVLLVIVSLIAFVGWRRYVGIGVALLGIVAASSQTALVVAGVMIVLAVALTLRRAGAGTALALGSVVLLSGAVVGFFVWVNEPREQSIGSSLSKITFSNRTDVWQFVLRQDIPFTGMGQSRIETLFAHTRIEGAVGVASVHNALLDGYARDGYLGLLVLVVMLVILIAAAVSRRAELALLPIAALVIEGALEVTPTHVPFYALVYALVVISLHTSPTAILGGPPAWVRRETSAGWRLPGREGATTHGLPDPPIGRHDREQDLREVADEPGS